MIEQHYRRVGKTVQFECKILLCIETRSRPLICLIYVLKQINMLFLKYSNRVSKGSWREAFNAGLSNSNTQWV